MRVIGADGEQVGVLERDEALAVARDRDGYSDALIALEREQDALHQAKQAASLRQRFAAKDPFQQLLTHSQLAAAYSGIPECKNAIDEWKKALATANAMPQPPLVETLDAYVMFASALFDCDDSTRGLEIADKGQTITADQILIATGVRPWRPAFPGAELGITSDDAFHLPELPKRILIAGGGYIAVEFAGIFAGLGVETTLIYR